MSAETHDGILAAGGLRWSSRDTLDNDRYRPAAFWSLVSAKPLFSGWDKKSKVSMKLLTK